MATVRPHQVARTVSTLMELTVLIVLIFAILAPRHHIAFLAKSVQEIYNYCFMMEFVMNHVLQELIKVEFNVKNVIRIVLSVLGLQQPVLLVQQVKNFIMAFAKQAALLVPLSRLVEYAMIVMTIAMNAPAQGVRVLGC